MEFLSFKSDHLARDEILCNFEALRVEFLLKTDSGYPKYAGVGTPWSTLGIPSAITPLGLESRVLIEN